MKKNGLVEQAWWDRYWGEINLPAEVKRTRRNSSLNEIIGTFDRFFPKDSNLSILEIGGAPGQYLAYFANRFHYKIASLDYSGIGCEKTKENFKILNLNGVVYQRDLFSDISDLPLFDIVYSLGFVEHFSNLEQVVEKHLKLLKPGGTLLIGTPNFLGINHRVLKRLEPELLSQHNLFTMNTKNWEMLEKRFNLEVIFKGYVGGFEPALFASKSNKILRKLVSYLFKGVSRVIDYLIKPLRVFNCKYWSYYMILIYRKPE